MTASFAAWLVTFLCVCFSARIATAFLRHSPRLFTVMALFACAWTLVLGFYSAPTEKVLGGLVSELAAFLFVYIGALLMVEARDEAHHIARAVPLQSVGLILLIYIALPKDFSFSLPASGGSWGLNLVQTKSLIGFCLDLAGCLAIGIGARGIAGKWAFGVLALILGVYVALYANYYYEPIVYGTEPGDLTYTEKVIFTIMKAAFTVTFGAIVAYHGMLSDDRAKGLWHWKLMFFGLAGKAPNSQRAASAGSQTQLPP